jgi:hypothetical protein
VRRESENFKMGDASSCLEAKSPARVPFGYAHFLRQGKQGKPALHIKLAHVAGIEYSVRRKSECFKMGDASSCLEGKIAGKGAGATHHTSHLAGIEYSVACKRERKNKIGHGGTETQRGGTSKRA